MKNINDADYEDFETIPFSNRFKRRINRLFREEVGSKKIPHPEVDNLWERIRSGNVCLCKKCNYKRT